MQLTSRADRVTRYPPTDRRRRHSSARSPPSPAQPADVARRRCDGTAAARRLHSRRDARRRRAGRSPATSSRPSTTRSGTARVAITRLPQLVLQRRVSMIAESPRSCRPCGRIAGMRRIRRVRRSALSSDAAARPNRLSSCPRFMAEITAWSSNSRTAGPTHRIGHVAGPGVDLPAAHVQGRSTTRTESRRRPTAHRIASLLDLDHLGAVVADPGLASAMKFRVRAPNAGRAPTPIAG